MLFQASAGLVLLLQLVTTVSALPTDQRRLGNQAPNNAQAVRTELKKAEIIPTVITDFLPSLTLAVSWPKRHAKLGNTLKPAHLQDRPTIILRYDTSAEGQRDPAMTYVVTLTDPDAPSRDNPEWSEMCHWIAANVSVSSGAFSILPLPELRLPGTETEADERSGNDVVQYKPPGPPPKTGKHRYVFLVFAPRNGTTEPLHLSEPEDRRHWGMGSEGGGVRDWAEMNELVPVAANFVYSKNKKQ